MFRRGFQFAGGEDSGRERIEAIIKGGKVDKNDLNEGCFFSISYLDLNLFHSGG